MQRCPARLQGIVLNLAAAFRFVERANAAALRSSNFENKAANVHVWQLTDIQQALGPLGCRDGVVRRGSRSALRGPLA